MENRIGKFLRMVRIKNNESAVKCANRGGVTPQAISFYETGRFMPSLKKLDILAKCYNLSNNEKEELRELIEGKRVDRKITLNLVEVS